MTIKIDAFFIIAGRIATGLISILSIKTITSLLEPSAYAGYILLISFQGLFGLIAISPIGLHINRHTHTWWDEGSLFKRIGKFNRYLLLVSAAAALLVAAWQYTNTINAQNDYKTIALSGLAVGIIIYTSTLNSTFVGLLNMLGFRSSSISWMLFSSCFGLIFSIILTKENQTGISWILGQSLGMTIGTVGSGITLMRKTTKKSTSIFSDNNTLTLVDKYTLLTYCLPLAIATALIWIQNSGYRFWVNDNWGATELGLLAVGLGVSTQIWTITESISMQLLTPFVFRHIKEVKNKEEKIIILSGLVNIMWPSYAIFAGFNILFASLLINILTDQQYHSVSQFILLGTIIEFSRCTSNLWSYAAQIERNTTKYILPHSIGIISLIIGLTFISITNGSVIFIAITLSISAVISCVTMIITMQQLINVRIDKWRWSIASLIFLGCALSAIITPIQPNGFLQTYALTATGLIITSIIIIALTSRSIALKHLTSVALSGGDKA